MVVPKKYRKQALEVTRSAHRFKNIMRRAKNLYLDPDAIEHGEEYARIHRTNLSQLVNDFLRSLQLHGVKPTELSPVVQRLVGAAIPRKRGKRAPEIEDYHRYLMKKYGE